MAKILIVEDNIVVRKDLKKIIESLGHTVIGELEDSNNLVNLYQKLQPDIITLDLVLKKSNGLDALKKLKKNFPDSKVIIISVTNNKKEIFDALNFGADYFIIKPITEEKLRKALNKIFISPNKVSKIRNLYKKQDEEDIVEVYNIDGVLKIYIKKPISGRVLEKINKVVDGLLIIKPLKIVFTYFDNEHNIFALKKSLNDIMLKIKRHGGDVDIEI
ncbi:response regulator with CheY-like receiver, AAA-type ATPase, and DNA-binding domains [Marinitoga piezophila KA3]|uniref:Response regulator with CheY-like receiver, AAA-type ATPase, and DNA-binding domains n=1 Tax=Marinitoga piezophila (strain DSM 14283 / JCM 11233 / KA3) TaxID=443254 RepID=H2J3N1_MARPK|nr:MULTISPECIES: response regulator [Marinitoga]AEX84675.1 response regulator with CheY-like receiver, AAA-type ATPase, and DNA-binding domains [Marinitoga piezophila KA3]